MPVSDNVNKFDELANKGKYKELLEYSLMQDGVEARYWELYTLFYLGRFSKCEERYLEYEHYFEADIWRAKFLHIEGLIHWGHKSKKSLEYFEQAIEISERINYKRGMVDNYNYAGEIMLVLNIKNGYEFIEKAFELANEIDYKVGMIRSQRSMCVDLISKSKYEDASEYIMKALELSEESDNVDELSYSLFGMGRYYTRIKELDNAIMYLERCNKLAIQLDNWWNIANSMASIALIDHMKGDLDLSLNKCIEVYEIELKIGNKSRIAFSLERIAEIYEEKGELANAMDNYQYALRVNEEEGNLSILSQLLVQIGKIYKMMGDHETALSFFENGYQIGHEVGSSIYLQSPLSNLISLLSYTDRERAKVYMGEFEEIERKENNIQISDQFQFTRAEFMKSSNRLNDKMQAQVILKEIFDKRVSLGVSTLDCIPHLLELLIIEYELSKEKEVLVRSINT